MCPVVPNEKSFFDGIDTSLLGIATLAHGDRAPIEAGLKVIRQHVTSAMLGYVPSAPEKIAPELRDGYLATKKLMDEVNSSSLAAGDKENINFELRHQAGAIQHCYCDGAWAGRACHRCAIKAAIPGTAVPPLAADETLRAVTPGQQLQVRVHVSTGIGEAKLGKVWLSSPDKESWGISRVGAPGLDNPKSTAGDVVFRVTVPQNAAITRPYFSRPNTEQPYYDIQDPRWLNLSYAPYPLAGWAEFDYNGVPIRLGQIVQTMHRVQGPGAVYEPLVVTPEVSVTLDPTSGIVPLPGSDFPVRVALHSDAEQSSTGSVHLQVPEKWSVTPESSPFRLNTGEDSFVTFTVHPANLEPKMYTIKAVAQSGNFEYTEGYQKVGYTGVIPDESLSSGDLQRTRCRC